MRKNYLGIFDQTCKKNHELSERFSAKRSTIFLVALFMPYLQCPSPSHPCLGIHLYITVFLISPFIHICQFIVMLVIIIAVIVPLFFFSKIANQLSQLHQTKFPYLMGICETHKCVTFHT